MNKKLLCKCERCGEFISMDELRNIEITDYRYEDISYDYFTICSDCHRELVDWFLIKE